MKKLVALALVLVILVGGTVGCEKPKASTPAGTGGAAPSKSN